MDADRLEMIGLCAVLILFVACVVVIVWQEHIKRRRREAFLRWQESAAGEDFRWVSKDGTGESPGIGSALVMPDPMSGGI